MDSRPIVTYHGDRHVFFNLRGTVATLLPKEPVEWRRSYGRPRTVYLEAVYEPYKNDALPNESIRTLVKYPFFHTFWTDCDNDGYKSYIKDAISAWLNDLKAKNITDWLIVIVNNDESKKNKLLPRMSVIDRVKADFCSKYPDKCIVLTDPQKPDKNTESWQNLMNRLRVLILQSIDRNMSKFEESMRSQREKRNEAGWNFSQYFMLQEELALMFEMLGLYEESLVQYDELDALFTQFVVNHVAGETAQWLTTFSQHVSCWEGLALEKTDNARKQQLIKQHKASILDLRNYLFSRQCALLFLLYRPWEVAQRATPFMHNCVAELGVLEVEVPKGAIACWVYLSCLEVLHTCERFTDSGQMESYSLHTSSLWEYARVKLKELGHLCGLMPDDVTTSEQLNMVVDLLAGIDHKPTAGNSEPTPRDRLSEALSSKTSFQKQFLESSELAMGTFKHIGRIRSARLIGKDLAVFYIQLKEYSKAEGFLLDAYKMYRLEGWHRLADDVRIEIANCQKLQESHQRYVKSTIQLASSKTLLDEKRDFYLNEFRTYSEKLESSLPTKLSPALDFDSMNMLTKKVVLGEDFKLRLQLTSRLPGPVTGDIRIAIQPASREYRFRIEEEVSSSTRSRASSTSSISSIENIPQVIPISPAKSPLIPITQHLEMKSDNTIGLSSLVCTLPPRKPEVSHVVSDRDITKDDYTFCLEACNVTLNPGENIIELQSKAESQNCFSLNQLCVSVNKVDFLKSLHDINMTFAVENDEPSITLRPKGDQSILFGGLQHELLLELNTGSYPIKSGAVIKIRSLSDELKMTLKEQNEEGIESPEDGGPNWGIVIGLPDISSYETFSKTINIHLEKFDYTLSDSCVQVQVHCDWLNKTTTSQMKFRRVADFTDRLYTAGSKKFVQIKLRNNVHKELLFSNPVLIPVLANDDQNDIQENLNDDVSSDVILTLLNKRGKTDSEYRINPDQTLALVWALQCNLSKPRPLKIHLKMRCQATEAGCDKNGGFEISYYFYLVDYQTQYMIKAEVSPPEGETSCKAGQLCPYRLHIEKLYENCDDLKDFQLMYEVLVDNQVWTVRGKTTGLLPIEEKDHQITMEVMPLIGGFLPIPDIRLLKYTNSDKMKKDEEEDEGAPQLFSQGEVFNRSRATQIHVFPDNTVGNLEIFPI